MDSTYQFNYIDHGNADQSTVLFLHGFLGSCEDVTFLSDKYRVMGVDLPGHGKTVVRGGPESYRMENCAAGLVRFLDETHVDKCHLVAYSMGGRLGLFLAIKYPERFCKVVLESVSPGLRTKKEREARIAHDEALARRLETGTLEQFLTHWYAQPLFATLKNDRHRFRTLWQRRLKNDKAGLCLSLRMMGTGMQPSLWDELDRMNLPLLLIVGEKDGKFRRIGREVAARCKTASLCVVPGAGHNVHFEQPDSYNEAVRQFLQG